MINMSIMFWIPLKMFSLLSQRSEETREYSH